ncbi:hypothetical protein BJX99DRAFT_257967 [Aspergillus californicus]
MRELASKQQILDLATWPQWYSFDVIGQLYFSSLFGFMELRCDLAGYTAFLERLLPVICAVSVMPRYARMPFLFVGLLFRSFREALFALKQIEMTSGECIRERLKLIKENKNHGPDDILGKVLAIYENKGEEMDFDLTDVQIDVYAGL